MDMRQLTKADIINIYTGPAERHFPEDERKPLPIIETLYEKGHYEGLGLYDKDTLTAYAFFIKIPGQSAMLLDYYAVMEQHRSNGMGSFFLSKMVEFYADKDGIILETEDPKEAADEKEKNIRNKRNAFYLRNNADFTDTQSILFGVKFNILYLPIAKEQDNEKIHTELENIYKVMLGSSYNQNAKLWRNS